MAKRVEVRAARPAEYPAVLETVCAAFGERVRPLMTAMLWGNPTLTAEDIRVAIVDGVIASAVRIADRPIHWGSDTLRLAGIGAVSTHPNYRGRGLASRVLEDAARSMRERGYPLGLLFTGIPDFYARLGWQPVPEPGFRVTFSPLPSWGERAGVRAFDESRDLAAVMRIYDATNDGRFGPHLRSPAFWTCAHARERRIMPAFVAERNGQVVAYASTSRADEAVTLYEAGCLPGAEDAFTPLAMAIVDRARALAVTIIDGRLPPDHDLRRAFARLDGVTVADRPRSGMMLLPLDPPALCRAATAQGLPDWSAPWEDRDAPPFTYWWPDHF